MVVAVVLVLVEVVVVVVVVMIMVVVVVVSVIVSVVVVGGGGLPTCCLRPRPSLGNAAPTCVTEGRCDRTCLSLRRCIPVHSELRAEGPIT
jgi:hypothetical protein